MKKTIVSLAILGLLACNKQGPTSGPVPATYSKPHAKFRTTLNGADREGKSLFEIVQEKLHLYDSGDDLQTIDTDSTFSSGNKTYDLVGYTSTNGSSNILIIQTFVDGVAVKVESKKCEGPCGCLITVFIDNQSNVSVSCTCSPCVVVSN